MKRTRNYILRVFADSKDVPSIRRILAFILTIHFVFIVNKSLNIFEDFIKERETLEAGLVSSVGSTLANVAMIVGVEAGLIAALLALTTYQAFQYDKATVGNTNPNPISNPEVNLNKNNVGSD